MTTWIVIAAVGIGSYVMRALPVMLDGRWRASARFEQIIGHAGTAALAALITVGFRQAAVAPAETAAVAVAAVSGLLSAVQGRSMLRILLVGTAAYGVVLAAVSVLA